MKRESVIIYVLMLGIFAVLSTEMGFVGILPQISQYFGVSISQSSLFISLFTLGIVVSSMVSPLIFSKYDRRKSFILVLFVFTVFTFLSVIVEDFFLALICRFIPAIFSPIYCGLALSVASQEVPKEESQSSLGKIFMSISAGMIVIVPFITFVASNYSYQLSMLVLAIINLVALAVTVMFFPSIPGKEESYSNQISVAKDHKFIISVIGIILLDGGVFGVFSFVSEFLRSVTHIVDTNLSIVLLIYGIFAVLGNWLGAKLLHKNSNRTVLLTPILFSALLGSLFYLGRNIPITIVLMAIWGLSTGILNDVVQFWVVSAAQDSLEFANGIFLSMGNLGITVGTMIAGDVLNSFGVEYILVMGVAIMILALSTIYVRIARYGS